MKFGPVGARFHVDRQANGGMDGQTDITKLMFTFSGCTETPNPGHLIAFKWWCMGLVDQKF